jgi:hypothetical protein
MKKYSLFVVLFFKLSLAIAQEQRHSFAPLESVIYSNVALNITNTLEWSTDRLAFPGYFSAYDTAQYINPSDNYNINGHVKHYVRQANQGYLFPVGTGTDLRTLQTSGTIVNNSEFATAWILGDPSAPNDLTAPNAGGHSVSSYALPLKKISTVGQWDWQDLSNTSAGVTITVSIPSMVAFSPTDSLRLAGWDGTKWIDLSGGPAATGNTENSLLTGTMQANITALAIATVFDVTLPVTIKRFVALPQACDALVTWETASEEKMSYYELQQGYDGLNFTPIKTIQANRYSSSNVYQHLAIQPQGQAYYRLKMVEFSGAFTYSYIISNRTNCNNKNFMVAYPNPVSNANGGIVTVNFRNYTGGKGNIVMYDVAGKLIYKETANFNGTSSTFKVNMRSLPQAQYFLSITDTNNKRIGDAIPIIKLQ